MDFRVRKMLEGWMSEVSMGEYVRDPFTPDKTYLFQVTDLMAFSTAFHITELLVASRWDTLHNVLQMSDYKLLSTSDP